MINCITKYTNCFIKYAEKCESLLLLIARLWIANIFYSSGILKFEDFDTTIFLFTEEHPVPFLPPLLAAYSAVLFELGCSVFLAIGLATRFAAIPLIIMTAVIQFTYLDHTDHFYWAMLLGFLVARGGGFFSVDRIISWKFGKRETA